MKKDFARFYWCNTKVNKMENKKALVVLSGGLDSVTALHWAYANYQQVRAVYFAYGSKHSSREYQCAEWQCNFLNIRLTRIEIPLDKYFTSSLLQGQEEIPEGRYDEENMKSTVVPFRNGIMLAIAGGYAESIGYDCVVLGNHAGDHTIYPDCRDSFISAFSQALKEGTWKGIELVSPFCNIKKEDIVKIGSELGVNYDFTYSCYKGHVKHCGVCGTCTERKEAFEKACILDTTEYEK